MTKIVIIICLLAGCFPSRAGAYGGTRSIHGGYKSKYYDQIEFPANNNESAIKRGNTAARAVVENEKWQKLIMSIENWIGAPYRWGGDSLYGIDCSAFVRQVFSQVNIKLPRTSYEQFAWLTYIVAPNELQRGDLVFFDTGAHYPEHDVSHVAIYLGDDMLVHASSSHGVALASFSYLKGVYTFRGARRIDF